MGDVNALILFLVIGVLPIFVREFRNSARITLAYWFVIGLHQSVAFTNTFLFTTLGAAGDSHTYHTEATKIGQALALNIHCCDSVGRIYSFFEGLLGTIYWIFGSSQLLGSQLSILMFAVSCIVLVKIVDLLELSHYRVYILLIFGSLPSMVLLGSVTLREPYQISFFMLAVYFGLKMIVEKNISVS